MVSSQLKAQPISPDACAPRHPSVLSAALHQKPPRTIGRFSLISTARRLKSAETADSTPSCPPENPHRHPKFPILRVAFAKPVLHTAQFPANQQNSRNKGLQVQILGLDIGGANIKAATADGVNQSIPFPLWRSHQTLPQQLLQLRSLAPNPNLLALTMTGELADCYTTKEAGVRHIIHSVQTAFPNIPLRIWLTSGEFADPDEAAELWNLAAASNWHALATWVARAVPQGPAVLIDIGSTTTDLIPILDGVPVMSGRTDLGRLAAGELVYTGVKRTPLCALAHSAPLHSNDPDSTPILIPLAAELFATTLDIHLLTGDTAEDLADTDTADGRPATRANAANRLAHQLCCDSTELEPSQIHALAEWLADRQVRQIADNLRKQADSLNAELSRLGRCGETLQPLVCGSGAWLADRVLATAAIRHLPTAELASMFIHNVSASAAAFATARLAAERCLDDLLPLSGLLQPAGDTLPINH